MFGDPHGVTNGLSFEEIVEAAEEPAFERLSRDSSAVPPPSSARSLSTTSCLLSNAELDCNEAELLDADGDSDGRSSPEPGDAPLDAFGTVLVQ